MKNKYRTSLLIITFILICSLLVLTHYSIIMLGKNKGELAVENTGCVSVIYSDQFKVSMVNPRGYSDEDGASIIPNTITISNYCDKEQEVALYIDLYDDSNISDNKMKLNVNGDINLDTTKIGNLSKIKGKDNILYTYKVIKTNIASFETKRINLRIWFDENETQSEKKNLFDIKYYVVAGKNKENLGDKVKDNTTNIDGNYYLNDRKYIKFANKLWQIVSVNSDNSIKIIYSDEELKSRFNVKYNSEASVSFENSTIMKYLEVFYDNNLKDFEDYIVDGNYCIDSTYTNEGNKIIFSSYQRNVLDSNPSIKCEESDKEYGGLKTYKIGLISADEVKIAKLYEDYEYYTISPAAFNNNKAFALISKGDIIDGTNVYETKRVRPVINLNNFIEVDGDGSLENPYLIIN